MHSEVGPGFEAYSLQNVKINHDFTGQFHWQLQNCYDRKCFSKSVKLRVYFEYFEICRSSEGTEKGENKKDKGDRTKTNELMLPRQRAFNKRKQQASRNQLKYNEDQSPGKMKKKLVNKMEDKGYGKYSKAGGKKGNYSRVNSGEGNRMKSMNSRSIGKEKGGRKKSVDKKGSRNNLMAKKKNSKSSLSQNKNKRSRGASQNAKRKPKPKPKNPEDFYQVLKII